MNTLKDQAIDAAMDTPPQSTLPVVKDFPFPYPSPADWRDHWIYFLLVDRFNNPIKSPSPVDYPCDVYQGGSFAGIKKQLPYLKNLGVGAIWLSPVLMNPQWFDKYWGGYGTLNFLQIEPRFCVDPDEALQQPELADKEFKELVDEAHSLGIYIILDIVLNHVGDVFNYEGMRDSAPWKPQGKEYDTFWRDEKGDARGEWQDIGAIPNIPLNGGIWPSEFQRNDYFRRRGSGDPNGDFDRMKELVTEYLIPGTSIYPVRNHLIRAYQYLIAKFDIDGYRIDTLQYVEPEFARVFGNAIREYALSIGKKNFFTFGEVWQDDDEKRIAEFIGRNTEKGEELVGVDAAIDFPIRKRLTGVAKGFLPPNELASHYKFRQYALRKIVSSHGDAGRHYVTFLDNHDLNSRFHNPEYPKQTKLALTCLITMQGIPCIYYGTEQGLHGNGDKREYAREALWGIPDAFSETHEIFQWIQKLTVLRNEQPILRYGRQYFREISGNGVDFDFSPYKEGILAFSRILNDKEILIVANTHTQQGFVVSVVVDFNLNPEGKNWNILFPEERSETILTSTHNYYRTIFISLTPMEVLILG